MSIPVSPPPHTLHTCRALLSFTPPHAFRRCWFALSHCSSPFCCFYFSNPFLLLLLGSCFFCSLANTIYHSPPSSDLPFPLLCGCFCRCALCAVVLLCTERQGHHGLLRYYGMTMMMMTKNVPSFMLTYPRSALNARTTTTTHE